jgi:hypothetical protein
MQLMNYFSLRPLFVPSETDLWKRVILCYSAKKHFSGLANIEKESDTDLNFLFGVRLLSILVVIICHKAGFTAAGPTKNPNFQEQVCNMTLTLTAQTTQCSFFFTAI